MSNSRNSILAFLSGAAIGAAVGLLYAPEKGEETRKKLNEGAVDTKDNVVKQWNKTSSDLNKSARKALSEFEERLDHTVSLAGGKADELIKALQKRLEELRSETKDLEEKGADLAENVGDKVKEKAKDVKDKAADKKDELADKAKKAKDKTEEKAEKAADKVKKAADDAKSKA